jgi:hypothetical protein
MKEYNKNKPKEQQENAPQINSTRLTEKAEVIEKQIDGINNDLVNSKIYIL